MIIQAFFISAFLLAHSVLGQSAFLDGTYTFYVDGTTAYSTGPGKLYICL